MFTDKEQKAVLQCIWQLLGAKPTIKECEYVEHEISNGWGCKNQYQSNPMIVFSAIVNGGLSSNEYVNFPWILCAIEQEPYRSFHIISIMDDNKKFYFKKLIKDIVEFEDNVNHKTAMAVSLFDLTNIVYGIRGYDFFLDEHKGSQTII
ncbi:hypothetical protein QVN91_01945 [Bacteroides caecigallinarum]|nr:hypothetical protein [Bacteroides caecigallinarum]